MKTMQTSTLSRYFAFLLALGVFMTSCGGLEKEIDLDLPAYEGQIALECYLEPGQPFNLLLTKSFSYFDPFPSDINDFLGNILEDSATVSITHNGRTYTLENTLYFNPFTSKIGNYALPESVPANYDLPFDLLITLKDGKTISASTFIPRPVVLDSSVVEFDEVRDSLARTLVFFSDNPNTTDYYRRILHKNNLDTVPAIDFVASDEFNDNNQIVFGSLYDYKVQDTIFNIIGRVDRAYFDYYNSVQNAIQSNGNPFGQPGIILGNLKGTAAAIGIFTGWNPVMDMQIVEK